MQLLNFTKFATLTCCLMAPVCTSSALAKTCDLAIESNDAMQFNKKELTVDADCTDITLTLKHTGTMPKAAMGHNWTLSKAEDAAAIIAAGGKAGLAADFIPANEPRVIATTKIIGGGESISVTFKKNQLKPGEHYQYFCTFPGHGAVMKGALIVK